VRQELKPIKLDSKVLAHLLRSGLLPTSYIPDEEIRNLRDIVRQRAFLVRMKTRMKNKIHSELSKRWINPDLPDLFTTGGKDSLRSMKIDTIDRYLDIIDELDEKINESSDEIKSMALENDDVKASNDYIRDQLLLGIDDI